MIVVNMIEWLLVSITFIYCLSLIVGVFIRLVKIIVESNLSTVKEFLLLLFACCLIVFVSVFVIGKLE